MFATGFSKIAEKTKKDTSHSVSGALLGGVAGHQAAKYMGATKGKSLAHDLARYALTLGAANRMSKIVGQNIKE